MGSHGPRPRMTCRACGKDVAASDRIHGTLTERSHKCPHGRTCWGSSSGCPGCTASRPAVAPSSDVASVGAPVFKAAGLTVLPVVARRGDGGTFPALHLRVSGDRARLDLYEAGALLRALEAWTSGLHSEARIAGTHAAAAKGAP